MGYRLRGSKVERRFCRVEPMEAGGAPSVGKHPRLPDPKSPLLHSTVCFIPTSSCRVGPGKAGHLGEITLMSPPGFVTYKCNLDHIASCKSWPVVQLRAQRVALQKS